MTLPVWLRSPDPDLDPDYLRRARYAYPHRESKDRPLLLTTAWGPAPFTVEEACGWAEREAERVLG